MRTVDVAKHRVKRRQIIDAAAELFAHRGFDGTTTAEICSAAGISSGNLFHYFASKREIFAAVLEDEDGEKARQLDAALQRDDAWAALLDVLDLLVQPATHPLGPPLAMEAMLRAYRDPELAAMLTDDDAREQATLRSLIEKAQAAGQVDAGLNPVDAASWISVLIGSVYLRAATNEAEFKPAEQLQTLRLIIERYLRP